MRYVSVLIFASILAQRLSAQTSTPAAFIDSHAKAHDFNGSILVQKDGRIIYQRSFGLANLEFRVPNTNRTKYKIASITKAFTSVLVLQLHEQGKIDLTGTIDRYLPEYAGEGAHRVTIHQLLNHTSGIDNFDKVKSAEDGIRNGLPTYQTPYTTDQLLAKFCSGPLVHEPGTVFDYNNADYIILGKIVERVSGEPFEEVLKKKILDPLKLTSTGMLYQHQIVDELADTYFFRDDLKAMVKDLPVYPENWFAAGAMYSTTPDLLKFSNALFGSKLLKAETLALMIKPGLDDYGYGVWAYDTRIGGKSYRVVKRPGQIMGAQSQLYRFLEPDVTVIILANSGRADLDEFVAEIGKRVAR